MSKTTFEGYVPSLKARHEATIVGGKAIESKGGSIRYMLQGEYDGRKTLPKTVSKAEFESVYGFDAEEAKSVFIRGIDKDGNKAGKVHVVGIEEKDNFIPVRIMPMDGYVSGSMSSFENHADTVGSPVKEAEAVYIMGNQDHNGVKNPQAIYHQVGMEDREGFETTKIIPIENKDDAGDVINEEMDKDDRIIHNVLPKSADTVGSPSPADVQPPAPSEKPFPQEPSNEHFEAFGLFGDKDEEEKEESDEPKTQEFTVVLQEGDKLELTDLPGDDPENNEENKDESEEKVEKEAENVRVFVVSSVDYETDGEDQDELGLPQDFTFALDIDDIGDTTDMQEIADEIVDDISDETGFLVSGFYFQEKMPDGTLVDLDAETYEAVQAKVTRPVKEDETEDEEEESDEGLLTPKNLAIGALGVGALALVLGAEDECPSCGGGPFDADGYGSVKCTECGDTFFESEDESDYWADEGQYTMNAEGFYESSSVAGDVDVSEQKRVHSLKDYDISSDYDGDLEIDDDPDLDIPEVFEKYEDELVEAVKEDIDDNMPLEDGETGTGSYDVDVEVEIPVRVTGSVEYNWTSDLDDEDDHTDDEWRAEEVSEIEYDEYLDELGSDALVLYKDNPSHLYEKAYPIDYEVGMNDYESSLLADIQSGYTENSMMFDEDENLTPYGEKVLKEMYDSLIDEALGIEWLADRHPPSELLKRGDPIAYRVGMSEYEDAFESESDGYAYAYTKGHNDGIGSEVVYRPSIATDREKNIYKKILRQKAETFEATGQTQYKIEFDDWPLFVHVDGCPLEVGNAIGKTYTADEIAQEFYQILYEHESLPNFRGNTFGELRKASGGLIRPCNCTINEMKIVKELDPATFKRHPNETQEHWSDTVGSPSPSGPSSTPEPAEATGSEPSNENFESPTKGNMKLIGGIGLLAAGLFALGKSDWVADTLNKYMK